MLEEHVRSDKVGQIKKGRDGDQMLEEHVQSDEVGQIKKQRDTQAFRGIVRAVQESGTKMVKVVWTCRKDG